MEMSFGELWGQMGWFVKGIVVIMIGMSVVTLTVSLAKWWRLHKLRKATRRFELEFTAAREADDIDRALSLTREHEDSHVAAVLADAKLEAPADQRPILGGRRGHHSEHLGHLLAVMQFLPRTYPDAAW